jgi:hypothetical protein
MQLIPDQVERFYSIWKPLLVFVNDRLGLIPNFGSGDELDPWNPRDAVKVRDALWADDSLLRAFIAKNPAGLKPEDLALVASWQHRVAGTFYILRCLKKHAIFIAEKESTVYGVLALASSFDEILPFLPCYVKAVLLPFEDKIIYDSLMAPYNIRFGKGIRTRLEDTYLARSRRAKKPSRPSTPACWMHSVPTWFALA